TPVAGGCLCSNQLRLGSCHAATQPREQADQHQAQAEHAEFGGFGNRGTDSTATGCSTDDGDVAATARCTAGGPAAIHVDPDPFGWRQVHLRYIGRWLL